MLYIFIRRIYYKAAMTIKNVTETERDSSDAGILKTLTSPVKPLLDLARSASVSDREISKDYFYFAAGLFNNEQLAGNCLFGAEIMRQSNQQFVPDLPQFKESNIDVESRHPFNIRAKDLKGMLQADLALLMFENMSLDEGILIELGFAKALGVPTLVVRTDFRKAGDQEGNISENWNLMCSDWPMHRMVTSCSIEELSKSLIANGLSLLNVLNDLYAPLASRAISAFTELRTLPPTIEGNEDFIRKYYRQIIKSYDGSGKVLSIIGEEEIDRVIDRKINKGLITIK